MPERILSAVAWPYGNGPRHIGHVSGFGVPADVDMVLDARFLPNPFFVDELRAKTGGDPAVAEYVLSSDDAQTFLRLAAFTRR